MLADKSLAELSDALEKMLGRIDQLQSDATAEIAVITERLHSDVAPLHEEAQGLAKEIAARNDDLKRRVAEAAPTGHVAAMRGRPGRRPGWRPGDAHPSTAVVMDVIRQLGKANAKTVAEHLGITTQQVSPVLSDMRQAGLVRGIGQGRYRDYELV